MDLAHNAVWLASLKLGGGFASIGLAGAGLGIGVVFGCFLIAYSKTPSLQSTLFTYALLGFALTEAIALFSLMMAFLILYT